MDKYMQEIIKEAKRTGKPIIMKHTFTESKTNLDGTTQITSSEMNDSNAMVIETDNKDFNFSEFFYNHLPAITRQEALLVHDYQLTPEQKRGYTQRFAVDVKYSPLEKTAGVGQVFELREGKREEHFEFMVKSLKTIKGTTYSVERAQTQE